MTKQKIEVGDLVDIEFYDHAEDASDAMRFRVAGEILSQTKIAYIIATWRYADKIDRAKDSNTKENENRFAIVKSAIINIKRLE